MNKLHQTLLALVFLVSFSSVATAQKTAVKANLLSPFLTTGSFFVEHALSDETSIQLGGFYTGINIDGTKFKGFGITPEFRYYLSEGQPALSGFYVAPFLRYQNLDLTDDDVTGKATFESFGGGLTIGRQWVFKERVALDLFIGPKYSSGSTKVTDGATEEQFDTGLFDGFGLRSGISLGIAF